MYAQTLLAAVAFIIIGLGLYYFGKEGREGNKPDEDNEWKKNPEISQAVGISFVVIGIVALIFLAWKYLGQG